MKIVKGKSHVFNQQMLHIQLVPHTMLERLSTKRLARLMLGT